MIRNKQIPADQLISLSPDLEGMVQNMHGQKTVGKENKNDQQVQTPEVAKEEPVPAHVAASSVKKQPDVEVGESQYGKYRKSTKLSERSIEIGEKDSEMDIFNKYVDYYAGQPGRGRAVWLNDELVDSFSILKDYDPRFSIRTVLCAALRTFIEKNASELAEIKNAIQKKGLF